MNEQQQRQKMVEIGRLLYARGWLPGRSGNFSVALDDQWLLTTPAGFCKGAMLPEDLVVVDRSGLPFNPADPPASSELRLHLAVYQLRPDVQACVHTHAPLAVACSVAGFSLEPAVIPEVVLSLGRIPTAHYALPGSQAVAESINPLILHHQALILAHHGTLAVGDSLDVAMYHTEWIEHTAQVYMTAHGLGALRRLRRQDSDALLEIRRARGIGPESDPPR